MDEEKPGGEPTGFLARWGRRKAEARAQMAPQPLVVPQAGELALAEAAAEPPPSYADVELLTQASDYSRFMGQGVDAGVQRAAMKKLFFSDPHFNLMDGLDTYIDDYSQPDPLPLSMLRQLHQSKALGLFELEQDDKQITAEQDLTPVALAATETSSLIHDDDHADLRLQQDDAAERPGAEGGAGARGWRGP